MKIPLQITYRDFSSSDAVEAAVRKRVEHLEHLFGEASGCRVVVEQHHHHHRKGNLFQVRIDLTVKGSELVVTREAHDDHGHESIYVAIRDAFDALERQLDSHRRRHRGEVKHHEAPPHGEVIQLFPYEDYGVIREPSGREVYFHRNSVLSPTFEQLVIGDEVRMMVHDGEAGPQASSVKRVGKHHLEPTL
jgi:ribosomal subunit interface protein